MSGHAIECRINAEDPLLDFRPAPGTLTVFDAPEEWRYRLDGPIRLDSHVREGYRIPPLYDSMIGKLIVHAKTRDEAIALMLDSLIQLRIEGVPTTAELQRYLLQSEVFRSGQYSTPQMSEVMQAFKTNITNLAAEQVSEQV